MSLFMDDDDGSNDSLRWTGLWWLPSCPESKLPGVFAPNADGGPVLELLGTFHASDDRERGPIAIVHGTTPGAEYITLSGLVERASSDDARGQYQTRYGVQLAVTGELFASPDSLMFQDLRIEYSTLVQWVDRSLVNDKHPTNSTGQTLTITTSPSIYERIFQGNGYSIYLSYGPSYKTTFNGRFFSLYPGAYIALKWDSPRPLTDTLAVVRSLRDFLAFATCMPTHVDVLEGKSVRVTRFGHAHRMQLFHTSLVATHEKQEPFLSLFSLKDVASNIEAVLSAWFEKGQTLQPVIDLHLAVTYNPQMLPESQFMSAVQAMEAFHRRMRDNQDLPEPAHKARIAEILDGTPEKYKTWLKGRLSYSNEPGLKTRLKAMFDEYADVLGHFRLDRDAFCKSVYDTRNYLTHYDQRLADNTAKDWDLQRLVYGLQLLVDIGLLDACGVDRREIPRLCASRHMVLAKPGIAKLAGALEDASLYIDAGANVIVSPAKEE